MIANAITCSRIILSVALLFFPAFSEGFYIFYLCAGLTDMVDGTIARKLGTVSEFGAKLDSVADIVFVGVAAFKILPLIELSKVVWIWILLIALIKVICILYGYVKYKRFISVHTIANKLTGFALFILPLTLSVVCIAYSSVAVCLIATVAAFQEGYLIRELN